MHVGSLVMGGLRVFSHDGMDKEGGSATLISVRITTPCSLMRANEEPTFGIRHGQMD